MNDDFELGYDPRPSERTWFGTPIPPVSNPLPATTELVEIAKQMWWNGDPWTILRNRYVFLRHAVDYATDEDNEYLWRAVPRDDRVDMLKSTEPGQMSMRSYKYWMWRVGRCDAHRPIGKAWHEPRHMMDLIHLHGRPISVLRKLAKHSGHVDAS